MYSNTASEIIEEDASVIALSDCPGALFPAALYGQFTESHFWCRARFANLLRMIHDNGCDLAAPLHGIEIGCGTSVLRRQLEAASAWTVDGADIEPQVLQQHSVKRGQTYLYDVYERQSQFRHRYDFMILFDVIEHIADDRIHRFIQSCLFHLQPGGLLFVNVPASQRLWSRFDEVQGHYRRYDRNMLREHLSGVEIAEMRSWGLPMLPVLALRKRLVANAPDAESIIKRGFRPPSQFVNSFFNRILAVEAQVGFQTLPGTSLMALARKT